MEHQNNGYSLIELLIVLALTGLVATLSIPAFDHMLTRARLREAASELRTLLTVTREGAIAQGRCRGIRFIPSAAGPWLYTVHEDGDGDGIRNDDIIAGIDRRLAGPYPLLPAPQTAVPGLPDSGVADPDTGKLFPPGVAPIAFGTSKICSFAPSGDGTPGSIYITMNDEVAMVRSTGEAGYVHVVYYNRSQGHWYQ